MAERLRVLFMQSQDYFGSDSVIHSLLMRDLNRERVEVHVACNAGTRKKPSAALAALKGIPDISLRPTHFGPTLHGLSRREQLENVVSGAADIAALGSLIAYCRHHRIQIIHGTEKPRDAFYGLLVAKAAGARAVTHMHVKAEGWLSPLTQWALHRDNAIIGISRFVVDSVVAMGYPAERVHCVCNAIDASRWNWRTDGASVRAEFGIAPEAPLLVVVSRLFHWKGHRELLKSLAMIRDRAPETRLLIVGEDDVRAAPESGSFLAELKVLARELGLDDMVIFAGLRSDVERIMAAADIYAMPSFEEPFGLVYLEAMAMKKPIAALDNGGVPEVVEHGKSGLLSPPGDIDTYADNLMRLIQDPALRREMGEYGRRQVEDRFSPTQMADACESVYRELLS